MSEANFEESNPSILCVSSRKHLIIPSFSINATKYDPVSLSSLGRESGSKKITVTVSLSIYQTCNQFSFETQKYSTFMYYGGENIGNRIRVCLVRVHKKN